MLALYLSRSFLCSERTTSLQDPPLRSGEKPIPLPLQHSNRFLPHSLPRLPQLALFACSHGNNLYAMVSLPRVFFAAL